jgi:hypothetical protein
VPTNPNSPLRGHNTSKLLQGHTTKKEHRAARGAARAKKKELKEKEERIFPQPGLSIIIIIKPPRH